MYSYQALAKIYRTSTIRALLSLIAMLFVTSSSLSAQCNCQEYIYLNEVSGDGAIHKYIVNTDGTLTEISDPWLDNGALGDDFTNPHGVTADINGNLYVNTTGNNSSSSVIRRINCAGEPEPATQFEIPTRSYNLAIYDNVIYTNRQNGYIQSYDVCTGAEECRIYLDGLTTDQNWGLSIIDNFLYATSNIGRSSNPAVQAEPNYIWKIDLDQTTCADIANPIAPFISSTGTFGIGNNVLGQTSIYGITADPSGNIYVVERDRRDEEPSVPLRSARVLKYDSNGVLLAISDWDVVDGGPHPGFSEPDRGFFNAAGLVYSETSDRLYVSTGSPIDDCVSLFDTDLNYLGAAVPWTGTGGDNVKAIGITTECCPTASNVTTDVDLCDASINDVFLIQDLINCDGAICEGTWVADASNSGLTYNACDNTVTINALNACGTFTIESDGTSANNQCGAFVMVLNISVGAITAPVIAGDQTICAGEDPAAFTVTTPATAVGTLTYQWQSSTTSCTAGFSDIPSATNATYNPPAGLTETTYYRVVANAENQTCNGNCDDISNCIVVTVNEIIEITNVTTVNPTCGEDNGTITFEFTDHPTRTMIQFSLDGGNTYPYTTSDAIGTFTVSDLAPGTYDLWTRWGNEDCPINLPDVNLVSQSGPAPCFGISVARN